APAELAHDLESRGEDGPAVARMRLDDLAGPFRFEQVGEAFRRLLAPDQSGVVGDRAETHAEAREHPRRLLVVGGMLHGDTRRHEGSEQAVAFPYDEMRRVR